MHIFYSPEATEGIFFLDEEESRHAVKVLRLTEKDTVSVIDGKGSFYTAEIVKANPKKCEVKTVSVVRDHDRRDYSIHVAIAPTKNADRIEWFTEKAVEIGIDRITFIQCQRSERKNLNRERVEKIAVSAMKQSQKATLPEISELIAFKTFIAGVQEEQRFIAHLEEGERKDLPQVISKNGKYCILIGPEGDFSPEEVQQAKEKGFLAVNLGKSRLRTETAGIVSCLIFNLANQQ